MMRHLANSKLLKIVAVMATIAAFYLLSECVDWLELKAHILSIRWPYLLLVSALYFVSLSVRSCRAFLLLGAKNLTWLRAQMVISQYAFLNYFLPLKLGELSFVVLLNKAKVPMLKAATVWVVFRVLDLVTVALFSVLFIKYFVFIDIEINTWLLAALLPFSVLLFIFKGTFVAALKELVRVGRARLLACFGLTVLSWWLVYLMYHVAFISISTPVPLGISVATLSLLTLVSILPVSTVANVGFFQLCATLVLSQLGMDSHSSLATGTALHIVITVCVIVVFLLTLALNKLCVIWFNGKYRASKA